MFEGDADLSSRAKQIVKNNTRNLTPSPTKGQSILVQNDAAVVSSFDVNQKQISMTRHLDIVTQFQTE